MTEEEAYSCTVEEAYQHYLHKTYGHLAIPIAPHTEKQIRQAYFSGAVMVAARSTKWSELEDEIDAVARLVSMNQQLAAWCREQRSLRGNDRRLFTFPEEPV